MITSFVLEWYNCSCHSCDDLSRTRTTIYKNKSCIVYEEFDGRDNVLIKKQGEIHKGQCDRFFYILEEVKDEMTKQSNYRVEVCDGSAWELKLRNSDNKIQKIEGTIEYPPHGKRLERELYRMCEEALIFEPTLFGCCKVNYTATKEFAEKWLKIFNEVPQNADYLFEEFMGNDCFALGFEMDCGHSFDRAYSQGEPLNRADTLNKIIDKVDDVNLLGSAIFSQWRGITHWSYESGFTEENKKWFLLAFNKLFELVNS